MERKENSSGGYWVGVDWGESSHAVAVLDGARQLVRQFEVPHSLKGMDTLSETLAGFRPVLGVAIESSRNLIVAHLLETGYLLYPINPKLSSMWRKASSVAGCKSDKRDGLTLARELSVRWESLEAMRPPSEAMRELSLLCRDEQRLIDERTRHVQRLVGALKHYFPTALEFFDDWTGPTAWRWLKKFSTPQKFAKASEKQLYQFLRKHRIGISETWRGRVENHYAAANWVGDSAMLAADELKALSEVAQLLAIHEQLAVYRKRIETLSAAQDDSALFNSLPGAGKKLAPRLLVMFGTDRERRGVVEAVRLLSGVAPVMYQSGQRNRTTIRRACKKAWRNTMHQFAEKSKRYCAWAKAFYDYRKACGDRHAQALRKLADKWLKIIHRMWRERAPYDDAKYLQSLYKGNSPLLAYLPVENAVENF